jgi:beta-barrel assembly-enhancing protease
MKRIIPVIVILMMPFLSACSTLPVLTKIGTSIAVATGSMDVTTADSINKAADAGANAMKNITPSEEYYIGRTIAASITTQYKPLDNQRATEYINTLGQTIAKFSDKPLTFKGYHFLILDTDEVNAFAAPGGFIFISKGLINCCKSEDELAAVLAHEIGHIQSDHALRAIKASRWTAFWTIAGVGAAKSLGGADLAEALKIFEDSIQDVMDELVVKGYDRKLEFEADLAAVTIMKRIGYNPAALHNMLAELQKRSGGAEKKGFSATHPTPEARIAGIKEAIAGSGEVKEVKSRQARFSKAFKEI